MNDLTGKFQSVGLNRRIHVGFADRDPDEVPFHPSDAVAKRSEVPRYLFRVFSPASAGGNNNEWIRSEDALKGITTDVFAHRDVSRVAIALNEHLRWMPRSCGDPFTSWTTSLLVAIQYAIYKYKNENTKLRHVRICIVDTTMFPRGSFMRDLDLMEAFRDKVHEGQTIKSKDELTTWGERGLGNFLSLRRRRSHTHSGVYYFGEYLSQGPVNIKDRSCTVSCDKIINDHLFTLVPEFKVELESKLNRWANDVIELREPFYRKEEPKLLESTHLEEAVMISNHFTTSWSLPMLVNLLALCPRRHEDPGISLAISKRFSNDIRHHSAVTETQFIVDDNTPEVVQFGKIMRAIYVDYCVESIDALAKSVQKYTGTFRLMSFHSCATKNSLQSLIVQLVDIVQFLKISSRVLSDDHQNLDTGHLVSWPGLMDRDRLQPLMRSAAALGTVLRELGGSTDVA
ncbi:hypothetical protein BJ170DRAFT_463584 [Xylariales sp. AK1849]|nr:hypothetical protein BJ170DRAFT_463584 [Xylariales sp. AK1849]